MKNVINYGTWQHNNDKDQNAQTVPRRTLAFLGTWPGRQHYPSQRMSYPQPTTGTPEAPTCQLSINFKKPFSTTLLYKTHNLPDELVSIDKIQQQLFPLTGGMQCVYCEL
jgi:hypothetical protein